MLARLSRRVLRSGPTTRGALCSARFCSYRPSRRFASSAALARPTSMSTPFADERNPRLYDDLPIVSSDEKKVVVGWDTKTWSRFHNIWLRDHCRCPKCFHGVTKQRLVNTFEIPPDIRPLVVKSTQEGLLVIWPSATEHQSLYPWSWLQETSYDPPLPSKNPPQENVLWGSKIQQDPPMVSYEEVMSDDAGLFRWLSNVDKFGFSFVSGVPTTPEDTQRLSERIGFIRETQYGKFWEFTSDLSKGDTAYTTLALSAHTDTTYYTDPCGLQLFHLLSHTGGTGGATLLVDGFYVASLLKELHPDAYATLSSVCVPAHAAGDLGALYRDERHPVLTHDPHTQALVQVRWNNDDRSVMKNVDAASVEDWYHAIRLWHRCLTSPDSEYWVQLTPGTAVVVDNHRVLHGRSSFDGRRRMCGAYIGIDEYRSRLAVLQEKYNNGGSTERSIWNPLL